MRLTYIPSGIAPGPENEAEVLEGFLNRPELRRLLEQEAAGSDVPVQELVHTSVEEALQRRERNERARSLLREWIEAGDEPEQQDTLKALKEGLNANHSSGQRVFP